MKRAIKVFVMDVDGTMTDGKIYMGINGEQFKAFDIKDGYGIHEILPSYNVKTAIMTGRKSEIVLNRAKELEIDVVIQNIKDKGKAVKALAEKYQCELEQIAYIGDGKIDLDAIRLCGVSGCPADAAKEVKEAADYIAQKRGGEGAVRDFIEWLLKNNYLSGE